MEVKNITIDNLKDYKCLNPLKIGNVQLKSSLILAPLAGFTDIAFRHLARKHGAGLTTTEMVSAKGLYYNNENTKTLLELENNETPSCMQLFGSEPEIFNTVLDFEILKKFDIIDINMGCPMPKIVKNGDGSALLKNPKVIAQIVSTCVKKGKIVTVKIRLGQDDKNINVLENAKVIQDSGASMLAVHGRTVTQLYTGLADWDKIGQVANALKIPVVGNGDVKSFSEAEEKIKIYGVSGVMIGRGAIGNPWIFSGKTDILKHDIKDAMFTQLDTSLKYFSVKHTLDNFKKQINYYLKNQIGVKQVRLELLNAKTIQDFKNTLTQFLG